MLGLHSLLDPVKKGSYQAPTGREKGGREKQQISRAVDFPQVPLVLIIAPIKGKRVEHFRARARARARLGLGFATFMNYSPEHMYTPSAFALTHQ